MISHKFKAIFIHIPKTAGSSIEETIWPIALRRAESDLWMGFIDKYHNKYQTGGLQHLLARQVRQEVGATLFDDYFKFAVVRNPWDKAQSQFRYMQRREDLRDFIGMKVGDCFNKYLQLIQKKEHVQWMPQNKFILDEQGDMLVDSVGRFENLATYVGSILAKLGIEYQEIPHLNKSIDGHRLLMDQEAIECLAHIYKDDIELFAYGRPQLCEYS